jgi:two-component system, NtrC family, response regulator HydG
MHEPSVSEFPILLVDDEETCCSLMELTLREIGLKNVRSICDSRHVLPFLKEHDVAVLLLDLVMPHLSGYDLLEAVRSDYPAIQIVVISGASDLFAAVKCIKNGVLDYMNKPVDVDRLKICVYNALRLSYIQGELHSLKKHMLGGSLDNPAVFEKIITRSSKMLTLFQYAENVAGARQPILITGETGVGKELMAHAVHRLSGVAGEFVCVNVAGLDDNTFSDTLFGHKKGAYTGADLAPTTPSSSTRSATLTNIPRLSCFVCCRKTNIIQSVPTKSSRQRRAS